MGHMKTKNIIFSHFQKHRLDKFVHGLAVGQELPSHITYSPSCSHLLTLLFADKLTSITHAGAHGMTSNLLPVTWSIKLQKVGLQQSVLIAASSIKKSEWMKIKNFISLDEEFVHSLDNLISLYICAHSCKAGSIKRLLFLPCLPFGLMHHLLLKRDG